MTSPTELDRGMYQRAVPKTHFALHWSNKGIGDACWLAACAFYLRPMRENGGIVCFVQSNAGRAWETLINFTFIDAVVPIDNLALGRLPEIVRFIAEGGEITGNPRLIPELLRHQEFPRDFPYAPGEYVVVQPATSEYKTRSMEPYDDMTMPVVLVGALADVLGARKWPGECLDLRGQTSIAQTMWLVAQSYATIGVESWVPLLGALFEKPSTMYVADLANPQIRTLQQSLRTLTVRQG